MIIHRYTQAVAKHYAAYRPPLHQLILRRALLGMERFADGLDVGCGTGRSSVALAEFCRHVSAIDPSQSMLDAAISHDAITYMQGSGESIPLPDNSIDIVTFAGSLFYVDAEAGVREINRICRSDALIVPYDFEILIGGILRRFGLETYAQQSTYNHCANLSTFPDFTEGLVERDRVELDVLATDLAHVLLADAARHDAFTRRYNTSDPFERLVADLDSTNERIVVRADIFYSAYRLAGLSGKGIEGRQPR